MQILLSLINQNFTDFISIQIQKDFDNRIALPISKHNRIPQKIMFEINETFYSCFDVMI